MQQLDLFTKKLEVNPAKQAQTVVDELMADSTGRRSGKKNKIDAGPEPLPATEQTGRIPAKTNMPEVEIEPINKQNLPVMKQKAYDPEDYFGQDTAGKTIVFEDAKISVKLKAKGTAKATAQKSKNKKGLEQLIDKEQVPNEEPIARKADNKKYDGTEPDRDPELLDTLEKIKRKIRLNLFKEDKTQIPQQDAKANKGGKDIYADVAPIELPDDEVLFARQYYPVGQVAKWLNVNPALLRFWEGEFDIIQPRKNKKGDRLFRPVDIKNLVIIHQLIRQRKFTLEGAKEYLKTNKKKADAELQLTQTLNRFKTFLLELKASL